MDVVATYGVAEPNKTPNKFIKRLLKEHPELFTIDFWELSKMKRVASGSFGTVYRALYNDEVVAAKRIDTNGDHHTYKYLLREILNLKKLNHPNVLQYIGTTHDHQRELYLVTDFVHGASLAKYTKKLRKNFPTITKICVNVAFGMRYMNSLNMLHRDLKPANIIVSSDYDTVKLCDFGLSIIPNDDVGEPKKREIPTLHRKMTCVGTGNYMAPEVKRGETTYASDVYSFGVMLAILLGYPSKLQKKKFDAEVFSKKKDKNVPPELEKLVHNCTNEEISKRPTFSLIATLLIEFYNREYRELPPLVDEEANIAIDVATQNVRVRRKSSARKSKHRSLELKLTASPVTGRARAMVITEAPTLGDLEHSNALFSQTQ